LQFTVARSECFVNKFAVHFALTMTTQKMDVTLLFGQNEQRERERQTLIYTFSQSRYKEALAMFSKPDMPTVHSTDPQVTCLGRTVPLAAWDVATHRAGLTVERVV
jgi:hypothetical protein